MNLEDIFSTALQKRRGEDRERFLAAACSGDSTLRARVDALLAAHEKVASFLEPPTSAVALTEDPPALVIPARESEVPGTFIGRYKLLQLIGEGGFGSVWMAEQREPIERKVALKVIKLGMDTRQVVARFEAERQALAMMDHSGVAKVFDAGATDTGRPYFVMELVKGVPITEYCDKHNFAIAQRLELFVQICQAVQHAHQKGLIHRDIKPTNILVAAHDGRAVAKVID